MQILHPAKANGGTCRSTRIFIEPAADVVPCTIRLSAENDIGGGVHNGIKFLVFLGEIAVELLQCQGLLF